MTEKRIDWEGDSYRALCAFPEMVSRDAGFQLGLVQKARNRLRNVERRREDNVN